MKKWISVCCALILVFTQVTAGAENIFSGIGGFFQSVGEGAGDLLDQAGQTAGDMLDRAGQVTGDVLDQAGQVVGDLSGQAGAVISSSWDSAGAFFTQLWDQSGKAVADAWDWTSAAGMEAWNASSAFVGDMGDWLTVSGGNALETIRGTWDTTLTGLEVTAQDAQELWNGLSAFAEAYGITTDRVMKIALPIISSYLSSRLPFDRKTNEEILQLVIDVFVYNNLTTDEAIDAATLLIQSYITSVLK